MQVMTVICKPSEQENAQALFWARVRFDQQRDYVPAGQVTPPPEPRTKAGAKN